MFRVKSVNLHLRNDVRQIYIYINKYKNSTVRVASVGLAQARPNYLRMRSSKNDRENWSGQNRTSRTACYGHDMV